MDPWSRETAHAVGQLHACVTSAKPACSRAHTATKRSPTRRGERGAEHGKRPGTAMNRGANTFTKLQKKTNLQNCKI